MKSNLVPNHFETAGIYVEGQRSSFKFRKPHLASFMSGMLVPLGDPIPVFPGVKLDLEIDAAIRSNTLVVPPLDGMYIDFVTVWVPHRIVWTHFPQFCGENEVTAWTQSNSYVYPFIKLYDICENLVNPLNNYSTDKSVTAANLFLATHYGLYFGTSIYGKPSYGLNINALAFRGYYFIWNYLFRDENYQRPVLFDKGDTGSAGEFGYSLLAYKTKNDKTVLDITGKLIGAGCGKDKAVLMPVNKLHDAFTSGLPQPQFGDASVLPLGSQAPVYVQFGADLDDNGYHLLGFGGVSSAANPVPLAGTGSKLEIMDTSVVTSDGETYVDGPVGDGSMYADLSQATAATINQFRTAVMYQRYLEALARGGRRVPEFYQVIYGVKNTAAQADYPLLLTRSRYTLGINQVVATADSGDSGWSTHLGDTGAFSYTVLRNIPCCEQDFTEFGYLHILYCVRSENRYSQMIQPHFLRAELLDEYNPFFDHIGDVDVKNVIVNALASTAGNFFYQEAWWDERTQLGLAVGAVNKLYGSLKYWTIGEVYDGSLVTCTPSYLVFNPAVYDDVMVSNYYTYPQFIGDFLIRGKKIARMSAHSIPGIVGRI